MFAPRLRCLLLILATMPPGCTLLQPKLELPVEPNQSLLTPLEATPRQVALEVIFVKLPAADQSIAEEVWPLVDEQALSVEARREATRNGFRAGVLGGRLPDRLEELLFAAQEPPPLHQTPAEDESALAGELPPGVDVSQDPTLKIHQIFLEPGESAEIAAGEVRPEMQLLYTEQGRARGRTFTEAQPQFALQTARNSNGNVELRLLPEIHYGQFKKQYRGGDGMFRVETTRDKETFESMALVCDLAPGELLLLGPNEERPGTVGHHFFTESPSGRPMRQLLLIRLQAARHDRQFLP